jgi:hypothetical protein
MPYLPQEIFSDRGKEFESAQILQYYEDKGILKFKANASHIKAAFAERMIRTIKQRLYRYFSEKNTTDWISVIPKITDAINHTICRSTGLRPFDIDEKNANNVWEELYAPLVRNYNEITRNKLKFSKGDAVRISRAKPIFEKGYHPKFSDEIFFVSTLSNSIPHYYGLIDYKDEPIKGRFYEEELVKTTKDTSYRIEKVIRKRVREGKKELLVKFIGYKEEEWIAEEDLV